MEPWEIAFTYLGTPFAHRGRTRTRLDCAGLLVVVAIEYGIKVKDLRVYGREPYKDGLRNFLIANCGEPVTRPHTINDVLLLKFPNVPEPSHLAIVTPYPVEGEFGMVHTYAALKRVVRHHLNATWQQRIVEVFQWPKRS